MYQKITHLKNCFKKGPIGNTKSLTQAIRTWESEKKAKIQDQRVVRLAGEVPPIGKLDSQGIKKLSYAEELSLSTNEITKLPDMGRMMRLKVLNVGRNDLVSLGHINVATTLKELYLSYNNIDTLDAFDSLKNLRVLSLAYNRINSWEEIRKLKPLSKLRKLTLVGNPLFENEIQKKSRKEYRITVYSLLPQIRVLDGTQSKTLKRMKSLSNFKTITSVTDLSMASGHIKNFRRASNPQLQIIDDEASDNSIATSSGSKSPKMKRPKSMSMNLSEQAGGPSRIPKNFQNLTVNTTRVDPHNPHQRYYTPKLTSDMEVESVRALKRHMSQFKIARSESRKQKHQKQQELKSASRPLPSSVPSLRPTNTRELIEEAGTAVVCDKTQVQQPTGGQAITIAVPSAHD